MNATEILTVSISSTILFNIEINVNFYGTVWQIVTSKWCYCVGVHCTHSVVDPEGDRELHPHRHTPNFLPMKIPPVTSFLF